VRSSAKAPAIVLDARSTGPVVSADAYGASIVSFYDLEHPFVNPSLVATGIGFTRYPGGSQSDLYHWEGHGTVCDPSNAYLDPRATFDDLMNHTVDPLKMDLAITLNYGSNRACNGGGEPAEAGAWVAYSKAHGYRTSYWTVGNEVYGSWEYDLHAHAHDPVTYSNAVRTGYYPAVKAADSTAQLGVVVDTPNDKKWNDVVLRNSGPFDFVEMHYYAEYQKDNDAFLLGKAVANFAGYLRGLRAEMTADGVASSVPIYIGEYNGDAGEEGKQSVSIVNGLFLGQMLGTMLNAGVPRATFWLAYGSCDEKGDYSKSLYGWQHFGSEAMFSDGLPSAAEGCPDVPGMPGGTPFPTARVMALFSHVAPGGYAVRSVALPNALLHRVRAFGFAGKSAYSMIFFNNTLDPVNVTAQVAHAMRGSFAGSLVTYGKAQYDDSKQNVWSGPVTQDLGSVSSSVPLTLPPYSVTALTLH
jgi:hypothetical protein